MAPPCVSFEAADLPSKSQLDARGRRRKPAAPVTIDLAACELLRLVQFDCHPASKPSHASVPCYEVQRLFRRCRDHTSFFTVETTAWERLGPKGTATRNGAASEGPR